MSFTLITGRANSGKTGKAHRAVRQAVESGLRTTMVLPTRPDVERARLELTRSPLVDVRITTFSQLIADEWGRASDGRSIVTPLQRGLLLRRAVSTLDMPSGTTSLAAKAVERLTASGSAWRSASGDSTGGVLEGVLRGYAGLLVDRRLVEEGEAADILGERVWWDAAIIFHRFPTLTVPQARLASAMAAAGAEVLVTLTWDPDVPGTEANTTLVDRLSSLGDHVHIDAPDEFTRSEELRAIGEGLFGLPDPGVPRGDVTFIAADGEEGHAEELVAELARLHGECEIPYEQIAVVYRRTEGRVEILRRALIEAGLKADFDVVERATARPLGRAFTALVRFLVRADGESLSALVRSSYWIEDEKVARAVETGWRRSGETQAGALVAALARRHPGAAERISDLGAQTIGGDPERVARAWESCLDEMLVCHHKRAGEPGVRLAQDVKVRAALGRLLEDAFAVEEVLTPEIMLGAIGSVSLASSAAERPGRIQVMGADRVRGRRFEAVIVCGLNAGEFPAPYDDPTATPSVTRLLDAAGAEPEFVGHSEGERALFYHVITRARSRLVLTRMVTDSTGSPLGASAFWEELRDFYRRPRPEERDDPIEGLDRPMCRDRVGRAPSGVRVPNRPGPGRLEGDGVRARLAAREVFAARELETYASCPYRWFVQHCVKAEGLDWEPGPLVSGQVAHEAARLAYDVLAEKGIVRVDKSTDSALLLDVAREAAVAGTKRAGIPESARAGLEERAAAWTLRSLRADASFAPGFLPSLREWSFGDGDDPPVGLGGRLGLKGRVDRIDVASDGRAIVVDYKSTRAHKQGDFEGLGIIQVPLYVHAVSERLGYEVVAGLYRSFSKGETRGFAKEGRLESEGLVGRDLVDDARFREIVETAVKRGLECAEGIREGFIGAVPGPSCEYCLALGVCEATS